MFPLVHCTRRSLIVIFNQICFQCILHSNISRKVMPIILWIPCFIILDFNRRIDIIYDENNESGKVIVYGAQSIKLSVWNMRTRRDKRCYAHMIWIYIDQNLANSITPIKSFIKPIESCCLSNSRVHVMRYAMRRSSPASSPPVSSPHDVCWTWCRYGKVYKHPGGGLVYHKSLRCIEQVPRTSKERPEQNM